MTQQQEITNYSGEVEPAAVFLSPLLLSKITEASQTAPDNIAVMLILASSIDNEGAVRASQDKVAKLCNISLKKLEKVIRELVDAGFIKSVEMGSAPDNTVTCRISPELVSCNQPEAPTILLSAPQDAKQS
jgi:hypothetical protein